MNKVLGAYWLYTCPFLVLLSMALRIAANIFTLKNVIILLDSSLLAGFPSILLHSMNVAIDWPVARTCRFAYKHVMVKDFAL
jgi:hypothetical protein